jgi:glutamine amidotransferase
MTVIIDYGVGNLFSLVCSFKKIGADVVVSSDPEVIKAAKRIILPGVGAFEDAAKKLFSSGLAEVLSERAAAGVPIMGICLGMQLLFEKSFEYGEHKGLGLLKGEILPFKDAISKDLEIPQIGWNSLKIKDKNCPLFKYINDGDYVYFVHSYYGADCDESVIATAEYGAELTAAVRCNNVCGVQFHPEKSERVGLAILKAFCEIK